MAAAVSNAGALGSIGVGAVGADGTREMIRATRSKTDRAFQVNVFCQRPATADPVREAAWLVQLEPEFTRYGARPPARLNEVYQSFLTDDTKLVVLLGGATGGREFSLRGCRRKRGSKHCGAPASCLSQRRRTLLRAKQ
jgi:NAD(P)H-dependent flavin oxidoreductase YrpB (nitropropane dioxygenase family)